MDLRVCAWIKGRPDRERFLASGQAGVGRRRPLRGVPQRLTALKLS